MMSESIFNDIIAGTMKKQEGRKSITRVVDKLIVSSYKDMKGIGANRQEKKIWMSWTSR
jgi:hypothetical protein